MSRGARSMRERPDKLSVVPANGVETRVRTRITFPDTDLHGI